MKTQIRNRGEQLSSVNRNRGLGIQNHREQSICLGGGGPPTWVLAPQRVWQHGQYMVIHWGVARQELARQVCQVTATEPGRVTQLASWLEWQGIQYEEQWTLLGFHDHPRFPGLPVSPQEVVLWAEVSRWDSQVGMGCSPCPILLDPDLSPCHHEHFDLWSVLGFQHGHPVRMPCSSWGVWLLASHICSGCPALRYPPGLCSTHESWVNFDSTLTQMSRVRVESAVKIQDMSRVRVESRWLSFESELSQLDTAWVKVESLIFRRETSRSCNYL